MNKQEPIKQSEFYKKVVQDLKDFGLQNISASDIAFIVENTSNDICVDYRCMSTGLHYNKKDIKEEDVIEAGFNWWPTWNFYEK